MLYKEYDPEILERLQQTELGILKDFDRFCSDNEIEYFACGGTAIGVLRHNGFIPWDDDIDVGMTRKNYNRFVERFDELSKKYKLITYKTTENFPLMTTRLVLKNSKFKEDCFKDLDMDNGIFLDIFCFDNIYDDERKMKRQCFRAWFWGKLLILWYIDKPVLYQSGFLMRLILWGCYLTHKILRLIYKNSDALYEKANKHATALQDVKTGRVSYMFDPKPYTSIMSIDDVEPVKRHKYEDMMISIPCRIEKYVSDRYGEDYMTLPPEDKRHNHPPYELKFPD